eukprot:TRINITY_DN13280_c0_g1_i1.p1 TRINITY_DN13280_c0_g1~~TRINITY_DN13280_c0_g1_i1.p1  ORF type:complete len:763 (+),score=257.28 TRINITY_DN13280_c0_g1_i1:128-2416(+)
MTTRIGACGVAAVDAADAPCFDAVSPSVPFADEIVEQVCAGRWCGVIACGDPPADRRGERAGHAARQLTEVLKVLYEAVQWEAVQEVSLQAVGVVPRKADTFVDLNYSKPVPADGDRLAARRSALPCLDDAEAKLSALAAKVDAKSPGTEDISHILILITGGGVLGGIAFLASVAPQGGSGGSGAPTPVSQQLDSCVGGSSGRDVFVWVSLHDRAAARHPWLAKEMLPAARAAAFMASAVERPPASPQGVGKEGKSTVLQQFQLRAANAQLAAKVEDLTACLEEERRLKTAAESSQWALSKQLDVLQRECDALRTAATRAAPSDPHTPQALPLHDSAGSPVVGQDTPPASIRALPDVALHPFRTGDAPHAQEVVVGRLPSRSRAEPEPAEHHFDPLEERRRKLSALIGGREPSRKTQPAAPRMRRVSSTASAHSAASADADAQAALEKTAKEQRAYILCLERTLEAAEADHERQVAAAQKELETRLESEAVKRHEDVAAADARAVSAAMEAARREEEQAVRHAEERAAAAAAHEAEKVELQAALAALRGRQEVATSENAAFKDRVTAQITKLEADMADVLAKADRDAEVWAKERGRWSAERMGLHVVSDKLAQEAQAAKSDAARDRELAAELEARLATVDDDMARVKDEHNAALAELSAELDVEHVREVEAMAQNHALQMQSECDRLDTAHRREMEELRKMFAEPQGAMDRLEETVKQLKTSNTSLKRQLAKEQKAKAVLVAKREEAEHRLSMSMNIAARTL